MKKIACLVISIILVMSLSGCTGLDNEFGQMRSAWTGREVTISTYDEESNVIDRIVGKSVDISADDVFATKDKDGNTTQKSSVLNITVGGVPIIHVGSSLIMYETGLTNVFEEYAKKVDITNNDRSTPFVNRMVNTMKNLTTGQKYLILIRSQSGKPLATFAGNNVSYFATDIDKSTGLMVDGKYLFIYRCDYTIYPMKLLENQ